MSETVDVWLNRQLTTENVSNIGESSSNSSWNSLCSFNTNIFGKDMNPFLLSPTSKVNCDL